MGHIADLARLGFLPLQNFADGSRAIDERTLVWACRLESEQIDAFQTRVISQNTFGDVKGAHLWRAKEGERDYVHMWSFATPAVLTTPPKKGRSTGTRTKAEKDMAEAVGVAKATPCLSSSFGPDPRFTQQAVSIPPGFDNLPADTVGIVVPGTRDDDQELLFMPVSSSALIAVNAAGDPTMASLVSDLTAENKIDEERQGPLHSMVRVAKLKSGGALAWQLTAAGRDGREGFGLVAGMGGGTGLLPGDGAEWKEPGAPDPQAEEAEGMQTGKVTYLPELLAAQMAANKAGEAGTTREHERETGGDGTGARDKTEGEGGNSATTGATGEAGLVYAYASSEKSGPFAVGGPVDNHQLELTADGSPVNSLHLSTNAYFLGEEGRDGPIHFDEDYYSDPPELPMKARGFLRWDGAEPHEWVGGQAFGKWKLETETFFFVEGDWHPPPKEPKEPKPETPENELNDPEGGDDGLTETAGEDLSGDPPGGAPGDDGRGPGRPGNPGDPDDGEGDPMIPPEDWLRDYGGGSRPPGIGGFTRDNPAEGESYQDPWQPEPPGDDPGAAEVDSGSQDNPVSAGTPNCITAPQLNLRASPTAKGTPDPAHSTGGESFDEAEPTPGAGDRSHPGGAIGGKLMAQLPQTAVVQGFGLGDGTATGWDYTQDPSTGKTPTAEGGAMIIPPAVSPADVQAGDYHPSSATKSAPHEVALTFPGGLSHVDFAHPGTKTLVSGGGGVRMSHTAVGLEFVVLDSSGGETAKDMIFGEGGLSLDGDATITGDLVIDKAGGKLTVDVIDPYALVFEEVATRPTEFDGDDPGIWGDSDDTRPRWWNKSIDQRIVTQANTTALTAGWIPVADANGDLEGDAKFTWSGTALVVGGSASLKGHLTFATDATYSIGAVDATRPLNVLASNAVLVGDVGSGDGYFLTAANSQTIFRAKDDGSVSQVHMLKARGSMAAPAATQANDQILYFAGGGYDDAGWEYNAATVYAQATEAWDALGHGTQWVFATTPNNSVTAGIALVIGQDKSATFYGQANLKSYAVAGLPGTPTAGAIAYASNGRKAGEGGGAGTGVLVFGDGANWIACDTGATVAA